MTTQALDKASMNALIATAEELKKEVTLAKAIDKDGVHAKELDLLLKDLDTVEAQKNLERVRAILKETQEKLETLKETIELSDHFFIEKIGLTQLVVLAMKKNPKKAPTVEDVRALPKELLTPRQQAFQLELLDDKSEASTIAALSWESISALAKEFLGTEIALSKTGTPEEMKKDPELTGIIDRITTYAKEHPLQVAGIVLLGTIFGWAGYLLFKDKKKFEGALALTMGSILGMVSFGQNALKDIPFETWLKKFTGKDKLSDLLPEQISKTWDTLQKNIPGLQENGFSISKVGAESHASTPQEEDTLQETKEAPLTSTETTLWHKGVEKLPLDEHTKAKLKEVSPLSEQAADILITHELLPFIAGTSLHIVSFAAEKVALGSILLSIDYAKSMTNMAGDTLGAGEEWSGAMIRNMLTQTPKYAIIFYGSQKVLDFIGGKGLKQPRLWGSIIRGFGWPVTVPMYLYQGAKRAGKVIGKTIEIGKFVKGKADWAIELGKKAPAAWNKSVGVAKSIGKGGKKAMEIGKTLSKPLKKQLDKLVAKVCTQRAGSTLITRWIERSGVQKLTKLLAKRGAGAAGAAAVPIAGTIVSGGMLLWGLYDAGMLGKEYYDKQKLKERLNDKKFPIEHYAFDAKAEAKLNAALEQGEDIEEAFSKIGTTKVTVTRKGLSTKEIWSFKNGQLEDISEE